MGLAFGVTLATAMCALVHFTHAQAERAARQFVLWFCVFCFLCTLWCSVPPQSTVHLHHWQIGFIAAIVFRRQEAVQKRVKNYQCFPEKNGQGALICRVVEILAVSQFLPSMPRPLLWGFLSTALQFSGLVRSLLVSQNASLENSMAKDTCK